MKIRLKLFLSLDVNEQNGHIGIGEDYIPQCSSIFNGSDLFIMIVKQKRGIYTDQNIKCIAKT